MNFSDFDGYMLGNMPVPWITMGVNFYILVFFLGSGHNNCVLNVEC